MSAPTVGNMSNSVCSKSAEVKITVVENRFQDDKLISDMPYTNVMEDLVSDQEDHFSHISV